MGWTQNEDLDHLNNVINECLQDLRATRAKVTNGLREHLDNPAGSSMNPVRVWYTAPKSGGSGEYIGLIMVEKDDETSNRLKSACPAMVIFDRFQEREHPVHDPAIQSWSRTAMALSDGPNYLDCPAELLDAVPPENDTEKQYHDQCRHNDAGR